jgi:adenylate kinase family enzyme
MPIVIGIAGVPGSGKSTITRALAKALGDASTLHMDGYERMTRQTMEQLADWAARGADVNELPVPLLGEHLAALKSGQAVTEPARGRIIEPARYIVFETQFGRDHLASGRHIDFLAWLDTPREVALARTLRQVVGEAAVAPAPELRARLEWLAGYLDNYVALVQRLVTRQRERVLPGADLVVDGTAPPASIVAQLRDAVEQRFGGSR